MESAEPEITSPTDPEASEPPRATAPPGPVPPPTEYPYATWGAWLAIGGAIMSLILGVVLAIPILAVVGGDFDDLGWGARAAVQICTGLGFLIVPFLIAKEWGAKTTWRGAAARLGFHSFDKKNAAKWIGLGFLAYIAFAIVYAVLFGAPEQDDIAGDLGPIPVQILLIVLLAPLAEEVCFRGMLFGGFRRDFRLPIAAIGAGAVFGLLHYTTGISAVPQLIVLGAIFAVVYEKTESIWPPIIFHLINNAYALAVINS